VVELRAAVGRERTAGGGGGGWGGAEEAALLARLEKSEAKREAIEADFRDLVAGGLGEGGGGGASRRGRRWAGSWRL
jgi:hypothetical protein